MLEGAVSPSLTAVVEHVRKGTLDFVLLKPADAQFLVSTAKFEPWRIVDVVGRAGRVRLRVRASSGTGRRSRRSLTGLVFLALAVLILYSIWILVVSAAFWVVKVDNLSYLFGSLFDVGRWPIDVLRGVWRGTLLMVFTFVFPVALMTTYPALALLGRLDARTAALALAGGIAVRRHRPARLAPRARRCTRRRAARRRPSAARDTDEGRKAAGEGLRRALQIAETGGPVRGIAGASLRGHRGASSTEATRIADAVLLRRVARRAHRAQPRALRGRLVAIVAQGRRTRRS